MVTMVMVMTDSCKPKEISVMQVQRTKRVHGQHWKDPPDSLNHKDISHSNTDTTLIPLLSGADRASDF